LRTRRARFRGKLGRFDTLTKDHEPMPAFGPPAIALTASALGMATYVMGLRQSRRDNPFDVPLVSPVAKQVFGFAAFVLGAAAYINFALHYGLAAGW
jgi:hypothetical protein